MEDLTPLYNKEFYLAYLCGEDVVLPIPDGNAERYLAYLCGMDVTIPDVPDGRTETYLAYKCGENVVLPDPMYRIEYYLAKWCGIDCEVPEPMYRIEYWLAQLANSGELKTVTGNPISISDALAKPAESLSIEILPYQSGSGDPSPDNVRPISGWSNVKVTRTGKNLLNPHLFKGGSYNSAVGTTWTLTDSAVQFTTSDNKVFTITPTENWQMYTMIFPVKPNETYYRYGNLKSTGTQGISEGYLDADFKVLSVYNNTNTDLTLSGTLTIPSDAKYYYLLITNRSTANATLTVTELQIELGSTATAYEPYTGTTYSISWQDSAGTVYGGSLDVTSGVLTVDRAVVDLGDSNLSWKASSQINKFYCTDAPDYKLGADTEMMCSIYKFDGAVKVAPYYGENGTIRCWARSPGAENKELYVHDDRFSDLASFVSAMSGVQLVYELATPLTYQLTPTEIEMLLGNNVIWNDVGDMVLEYLADGPADDIDALNILLNNRYVNNGEPDEATDREALEILLGGNTR